MEDSRKVIDDSVKEEILRYPMCDLIRRLYPDCRVKVRGNFSSPLREDKHPSFSVYCGHGGVWMAKDYSTGETFDNISFFRAACPCVSYVEAVDSLAQMCLGRSAFVDGRSSSCRPRVAPSISVCRAPEPEKESVLKIISSKPLDDPSVPRPLVEYWRSRGISDAVIRSFCSYVTLINYNRKGRPLIDGVSGLPLVDSFGSPLVDDGVIDGYGMANDIGGMVIRQADRQSSKGFKGATSSFISTFLADGSRVGSSSMPEGIGDNRVSQLRYDGRGRLYFNRFQCFNCVSPDNAVIAEAFMEEFVGRTLGVRDMRCICAVLSSLNVPVCGKVAVVEGMTDMLSFVEMRHLSCGAVVPGVDVVVLNSVHNARWAVPFLSRQREVRLYLDNDLASGAGEKASDGLRLAVQDMTMKAGRGPVVASASQVFRPYKDLNDFLPEYRRRLEAQKKKLFQSGSMRVCL